MLAPYLLVVPTVTISLNRFVDDGRFLALNLICAGAVLIYFGRRACANAAGPSADYCQNLFYLRTELSGFLPSGQLATPASSGILMLLTKPAAIRQKPAMSKSSTNSSRAKAFPNTAHVERVTSACSCNSSARRSTARSVLLYAWHRCGSRTPKISSSDIPSSREKATWLQNTYSEPARQPIRRIVSSRVRAATLL